MHERTADRNRETPVEEPRSETARDREPEHSKKRVLHHNSHNRSLVMQSSSDAAGDLPPAQFLPLLRQKGLYSPRNEKLRGQIFCQLQRQYGNRWVQRLVSRTELDPHDTSLFPMQTRAEEGSHDSAERGIDQYIKQSRGIGHTMGERVRSEMESRFGRDFSEVRLHTDSNAGQAARALGAEAFTTGRGIYFGQGAYHPETDEGKKLLAHELTHTIQQHGHTPGTKLALEIIPPDDPLERQADQAADAVIRGKKPGTIPSIARSLNGGTGVALVQRRPDAAPAVPSHAGPRPTSTGSTETGDFVIGLGGLRIKKEELERAKSKGRFEKDLSSMSLPGLKLKNLTLELERDTAEVKRGHISADIDIPYVSPQGRKGARYAIDKDGGVSFEAKAKLDIPALNRPEIELSLKEGEVSAEATLGADKLKPPGLRKLKIPQTNVTVGVSKGQLTGKGQVFLEYQGLAKGDFSVGFKNGIPAGKGKVELTPKYLKGTEAELQVADGKLQGELTLPASKLSPPIPGLEITGGNLSIGMQDGRLSGKGEEITFGYKGLGTGALNFSINKDHLAGRGALELNIPGLSPIKGVLRYRDGRLSGEARITANKFPKGLPVKGGSIIVLVDEHGAISGRGGVRIQLLGVGQGEFKLGYEKGVLDLSASVELKNIPGLEQGRVMIGLKEDKLEGEGEIAIAPKQIPGLSGNLLVVYKEDLFSGKAKIGYAKDKFSGEVELFLNQDEKGKLDISGSGEVTARLTEWLTGKVHIDVLPDATTKIAGQLKADDIELFPAKKADRELFNISQNIPLWAILVAVIRIRGGVRAGVGPGMLRGVTAEGQFSTGEGEEPSFSITGELFIPAYAEAYVAFGAGLGLDVVIGSLTGGIEAVGTAGIYGAVSVIPEIAYEGGDYSISGVATMAAGAKLKLGLNAWAEVEALWITVWSNEWNLAEWVWDVGPELAMQAQMKYVFGRPEPPTFDFKTSDIDAERLIQDAMPKEGPKGSGARESLQNRAEWKGKLKEQRKDPSKIPAELAQKQQKAPRPKAPPPKPSKSRPPADLKAKDPTKAKEMLQKELKEKAMPGKSKALDKARDEKFTKGIGALQQLRERSIADPEDPDEIIKHLGEIKAKYGFTTLTHRLEGEEWLVDAAMSPGKTVKIKAEKTRPKEGLAGTYNELRGPKGDRMTPDHEPQNALMEYISEDLEFRNRKLFEDTPVGNYSMGRGIGLNMFEARHEQTRTYQHKGAATKREAAGKIKGDLEDLKKENASDEEARKAVAKVVRKELSKDHQVVRDIYRRSRVAQSTKDRVETGLRRVWNLNRANYFDAFNA